MNNNNNNRRIVITISGLVIILITLVTAVFIIDRPNKPQVTDVTPTPTVLVAPTLVKTSNVKVALSQPVKYKDITAEYRPKSNTFIIFYKGSQTTALEIFKELLAQYEYIGDIDNLKIEYFSLDPPDETEPPAGFFEPTTVITPS